jgi:hypothetical protein
MILEYLVLVHFIVNLQVLMLLLFNIFGVEPVRFLRGRVNCKNLFYLLQIFTDFSQSSCCV